MQENPDRNTVIRVVITSRALDGPGGVVNFVGALIRHMPKHVQMKHLTIGRNPNKSKIFQTVSFPIVDILRLRRTVKQHVPHCVHINTSLGTNSLLRDGLLLITLKLMRYRKVLLFFHGWDSQLASRIAQSRPLVKIFRAIFGSAAQIMVLASQFRTTLTALGVPEEKVRVVTTMFEEKLFSDVNFFPDKRRFLFLRKHRVNVNNIRLKRKFF